MSDPIRLFVVGTDTGVGKTTVTCALLESAARAGVIAIPHKPAEAGPEGPTSDRARLLASSRLSRRELEDLSPLHWTKPVAPGMADDPRPFLGEGVSKSDPDAMLGRSRWAVARLEQRHAAQVSLIEGAGGLLVPMPGGTWQPDWILGLRARPLIVARAGLGTINHTLLTIEALRIRDLEPIGILYTQSAKRIDPSREDNPKVIEQRSGVPTLGQLPFLGRPPVMPTHDDWLIPGFWSHVLGS
ncbi:dethiobiotin synthase [Nannocystaceae bacterium ST9]